MEKKRITHGIWTETTKERFNLQKLSVDEIVIWNVIVMESR